MFVSNMWFPYSILSYPDRALSNLKIVRSSLLCFRNLLNL